MTTELASIEWLFSNAVNMSSLCWPISNKRAVEKEKLCPSLRYPLVFLGLWVINLLLVFFGMPFLIYWALKGKFVSKAV